MVQNNNEAAKYTESVSQTRVEAFQVLVDSIASLQRIGRSPTASEVRLELRQRTYNGFSLEALQYKRFRDFLLDAESNGHIKVDWSRPGDVTLGLPEEAIEVSSGPWIRSDLWKAFVDWTPGQLRLYDIGRDKAVMIPEAAAPLEPQRFREIRQRLNDSPENFVPITPISIQAQVAWMARFAKSVSDPSLKLLLETALSGEKPAKLFTAVLREAPTQQQAWRQQLSFHVREEVERWRDSSESLRSIRIEQRAISGEVHDGRTEVAAKGTSLKHVIDLFELLAESSGRSALSRLHIDFSAGKLLPVKHEPADATALRALVHAAIDRMPVEELKALRLPVGYLFED